MKYIEIEIENTVHKKKSFIVKLLSFLLPKANPDFDDYINYVVYWLIEFENKESFPLKEIGLNSKKEVIMKMPYKNNYGYWLDNDLTYNDFIKKFKYTVIDNDFFYAKWNELK